MGKLISVVMMMTMTMMMMMMIEMFIDIMFRMVDIMAAQQLGLPERFPSFLTFFHVFVFVFVVFLFPASKTSL